MKKNLLIALALFAVSSYTHARPVCRITYESLRVTYRVVDVRDTSILTDIDTNGRASRRNAQGLAVDYEPVDRCKGQ